MIFQNFFGLAAVVVGVYAYFPYFKSIFAGRTRPHLFTWVVWSLVLGITTAAQLFGKAGPGVWLSVVTLLGNLAIVAVSIKYGEKSITRSDILSFMGALAAVGLWISTQDPLGAVLLATLIGAFGYFPTIRKTWSKPHQEQALYYFLGSMKFGLSVLGLKTVTVTTAFYPAWQTIINLLFVAYLWLRRRAIASRLNA